MLLDSLPAVPAQDVYSVVTFAMNVVQTCFLAWLAVYARRR